MPAPAILQHENQETLTLSFPGDLLSTSAESIKEQALRLLQTRDKTGTEWQEVHLDLSRAKLVDSAGLNVLVTIIRTVKERGARITAAVSSKTVHRTLLFTRLDRHMEITVTSAE